MEETSLHRLHWEQLREYAVYLKENEKSENTVQKYMRDIQNFFRFLPENKTVSKLLLIAWKEKLTADYAASSINSMLVAVNRLLVWLGWNECRVKLIKCQRKAFCDENKELSRAEYVRLIQAAKDEGNERLSLVIETICSTGIRVSELRYITAEALQCGKAEIDCKGKRRTVFLPKNLCRVLQRYAKTQKIKSGILFRTKNGNALDRSNIWHDMKALCKAAGVEESKVFPHNLRHLFARTFYGLDKDIAKLADILGHSSIDTTRIYIVSTGAEHERQVARLGLVL